MTNYPNELAMKGFRFTLTPDDHVLDGKLNEEFFKESLKRYPWFFIEQFQNVRDPGGTFRPAKLNRPQKYIEWCTYNQLKYYNCVHLWILKPRQIGSSWYWGRHGEHHSIWYNHLSKIMAHAKDQTAIKSLFNYVMEGYNDLVKASETHKWLKPYLETSKCSSSSGIIQFHGASEGSIEVVTSEVSAVGFACQHAHVSEIPLIENFNEFWNQFSRSLHGAYYNVFVGESSAHHSDFLFLDIFDQQIEEWKRLKTRPPILRPIFIPPYMHDEYKHQPIPEWYDWDTFWAESNTDRYGDEKALVEQKWLDPFIGVDEKGKAIQDWVNLPISFWKWRRDEIDKVKGVSDGNLTGLQCFHEQFPMTYKEARISTGKSVFDRGDIDRHKKKIKTYIFSGDIYVAQDEKGRPFVVEDPEGDKVYRRWDKPIKGLEYFIGCDTANERVGDSTVAIVYSPMQNAFVACFEYNDVETNIIAEHLIATAIYWNNAMIGYESNLTMVGDMILKKLMGKDLVNPEGAPYRNIYWEHRKDVKYQQNSTVRVYGCKTSLEKKGIYAELTRDFIRSKSSEIYIPEYLDQVWHIEQKPDKEGFFKKAPRAPRSRHDDYWIAGSIALFIARDCGKRKELRDQMDHNKPKDGIEAMKASIERRAAKINNFRQHSETNYAKRNVRHERKVSRYQ